MVEVHLVRQERSAAVEARHVPELAQEIARCVLPRLNAVDLRLPIAAVVLDVVRALTLPNGHAAKLGSVFEPRL